MEQQVGCLLNDAGSTVYKSKPKQKELPLPFIPGFDVSSREDVVRLLEDGERMIAKPNIGCCSIGIVYLGGPESASDIPENVSDYLFERFIPSRTERRYIFLDGNTVMCREIEKIGSPGKETRGSVTILNERPEEDIVKKAIDMTGMFFGSVDFRQGHLLEINGSGTSTVYNRNGHQAYNISPSLVKAVERKARKA
jgi:glutathione synthase/RimK-type ligase-like ATP-grasp enzyme